MARTRILVGLVAAMLLLGGAALIVPRFTGHAARHDAGRATYYCPMHPTYTSDKPGDCPICQMRLVKRELEAQPQVGTPQASQAKPDICYLHNCPMAHQGRPCPMLVVAKEGEEVTCPICGKHVVEAPKASTPAAARKGRTILYWTDPMIPGYRAEGPGKSPMGMGLIPVYEEAGGPIAAEEPPTGYAPVLVSPQKQQLIGVRTAAARRQRLVKTIRAAGTIAHDPELYQAQAEYLEAARALERARAGADAAVVEQARQLVEATTVRLRHLGLSEDLIEEIATWPGPQESLLIARAGQPVWMYAKVYEEELPYVRPWQDVRVEVPGLPGQELHGRVRAIDAMVDAMTRTTRIRAELDNPEGLLKPDMFVNAFLDVNLGAVLAVPREAIFDTGLKQIVFVAKGDGIFEPREVTLGAKTEEAVEIRQGLIDGEEVVVSGNFLLDSESRLKAALEGLGAAGAAEAPAEGTPHVH